MDRNEAEKLLRGGQKGVAEWNARRKTAETILPPIKLGSGGLVDIGLDDIDLAGADLTGVDFGIGTAPSGAIRLQMAILTGANLTGANLYHTVLTGANLTGANLTGADLRSAKLGGANLAEVIGLIQAQLELALGDKATTLPKGLVRPASWTKG